jgi:hypothetical protein
MFFALVNLISYCRVKSDKHKTFEQTRRTHLVTRPERGVYAASTFGHPPANPFIAAPSYIEAA